MTFVFNKIELNISNNKRKRALYLAARYGDLEMVELLIQYKSSQNELSQYGNTPLHRGAAYSYVNVCEPTFCSNLTMETVEQGVKFVQS